MNHLISVEYQNSLADECFDAIFNLNALFFHKRQVIRIEPFPQRLAVGAPPAQAVVPLGNMWTRVPEKLQLKMIETGDVRGIADIRQ